LPLVCELRTHDRIECNPQFEISPRRIRQEATGDDELRYEGEQGSSQSFAITMTHAFERNVGSTASHVFSAP
jgi:hypothetical protein